MQQRDSLAYTVGVAAVLCIVCSLAVSVAAVKLKPFQEANEKLNQQKNILDATGLARGEYGRPAGELTKAQIQELYGWISEELVDLDTGEQNTELNPETYDPREAVQKADMRVEVVDAENPPQYDPGEVFREKVAKVYIVRRPGEPKIRQVVLPVYGKGLWGTLWGYLAVDSDLKTAEGLTFYEHKETPGLGGEVDNPGWKQQWEGIELFDEQGEPAVKVWKGPAPSDNPHAVDGLSGATITSRGVQSLINYWVSDDGYGPFLKQFKSRIDGQPSTTSEAGAE
jgi:Na+-transporting NADH:ubiquinone oxidoreductase subunit C